MKNLIQNKIENCRQFFICAQIVSVMVVFSNKLVANSSFDINTSADFSRVSYLELSGCVKEAKNWETWPLKNIENAEIVILSKENKVLGNLYSDKEGLCIIKLPLNGQFVLRVSKKGYVTKTITIDTRVHLKKYYRYYINFEIDMYEDIEGVDATALNQPVANIRFNNYLTCFDYDFKLTELINEKLKNNYVVYYKKNPEYKSKIGGNSNSETETNSVGFAHSNTSNLSKSNTQNSKAQIKRKNNYSSKNYFELGKGAHEKSTYSMLKDTIYANQKNSTGKTETKDIKDAVVLINIDSADIVYKIQLLSINEYLTPDAKLIKKFGKVNEYMHNGTYNYTIGEFKNFEVASKMLNEINVNGYKDAFLVAFFKGKRISIDEAKLAKYSPK